MRKRTKRLMKGLKMVRSANEVAAKSLGLASGRGSGSRKATANYIKARQAYSGKKAVRKWMKG